MAPASAPAAPASTTEATLPELELPAPDASTMDPEPVTGVPVNGCARMGVPPVPLPERMPRSPHCHHPEMEHEEGRPVVVVMAAQHPPLRTYRVDGRLIRGYVLDSVWDERDRAQVTRYCEVLPTGAVRLIIVRERTPSTEEAIAAGVASGACALCMVCCCCAPH